MDQTQKFITNDLQPKPEKEFSAASKVVFEYFRHVATVYNLPPIELMEWLNAKVRETWGNG